MSMLSSKQAVLMLELQKCGTLTLARAIELVGQDIYDNRAKHVGAILTRMVKRGLIVRVKPGVFERAPSAPQVEIAKGWWGDR